MRDTPDKRNYQRSSSTVVRDRVENKILSAARTQGGICSGKVWEKASLILKQFSGCFFILTGAAIGCDNNTLIAKTYQWLYYSFLKSNRPRLRGVHGKPLVIHFFGNKHLWRNVRGEVFKVPASHTVLLTVEHTRHCASKRKSIQPVALGYFLIVSADRGMSSYWVESFLNFVDDELRSIE
jgi:hypothetical protein